MKNILFILQAIVLFSSCSNRDMYLKEVLKLAGENRGELEKVLDYYKKDPEKLKAARFLIENMPGRGGYDTVTVAKTWQAVYDKHIAISEKHNWSRGSDWRSEINSFWDEEQSKVPRYTYSKLDLETVQADWLIREIELVFKAWKENIYTKDSSFDDFCRYILPFRFKDGSCLDNCRQIFYERHTGYFSNPDIDFRDATDSLHCAYSFIAYNDFAAASMPIYRVADYERLKRGSCDDKTWYNSLLMSSLGMAITTDFVPVWGNRSRGHSWNALIVDGETYPFEPFWDSDRWKYKDIYNNKGLDMLWGKFRLPKVYRNTYEHHFEGPLGDEKVERSDIPELFRSHLITDVSAEYFEPAEVTVQITEPIPMDTRYCYLAVFNLNEWYPVQWARIGKNGKAVFKDMGCDIVYLPVFYKNGRCIPAADPFELKPDGSCRKLSCGNETGDVSVRNYTSYFFIDDILNIRRTLKGGSLTAFNSLEELSPDTLFHFTDSMDVWYNEVHLASSEKYRFVAIEAPLDFIGLCDITFNEPTDSGLTPVPDVKILTELRGNRLDETPEMMVDGLSGTGFRGDFITKPQDGNNRLVLDLGKPTLISSVSYVPYTDIYMSENREFELLYWDNEWKSGGIQKAKGEVMKFEAVPKGTIYRLKTGYERIFTYEDGLIYWY